MKKIIAYIIIFILVFSCVFVASNYYIKKTKYDFNAQSINGKVNLHSFDGNYKVVYFGYCFCPDVCPTTLSLTSTVLNDLKVKNVTLLFITLDPERDSLKDTQEFAHYFYPKSAYGLRLDEKDLKKVASNYGVKFQKIPLPKSNMKYSIAHSSSLYLFDKKGNFVKEISNITYDEVKEEIENLVKN